MRRLLGISLLLASVAPAYSGSNLIVHVRNSAGAPIASANVAAISFVNGRPDSTISQIGLTNAAGDLTFNGSAMAPGVTSTLTAGNFYQIVASSQGFLPSFIGQFENNPPSVTAVAPSATPVESTITINSTGVSGVGEIDAQVINATTGTLVFGQVGLQAGGGAAGYGITNIDNTGTGQMQFLNVTTAAANVYQISAFDPLKNKSASIKINAPLVAGTPLVVGPALDFFTAPPPVAIISQTQASGQGGGLSVYGVVTDTTPAATPIPFLQLNFQSQHKDAYGQTFNDWRGAQTDQNGVFQLYDLNANSTYYTTIYGGCDPNTGACYHGFQSTAAGAAYGAAPGINDFLFVSTSSVLYPKIKLKQEAPSNGTLKVYVKDQNGFAFPQAGISIFPDGMPWQTAPGMPCAGPFASNPGFKNLNAQTSATGYYLLSGMPSGNYQLYAWTPFGQTSFNAGPDGQQNYGPCSPAGAGADDQRLTIDTTTPSGMGYVFGIAGNAVYSNVSSITVTVRIATGTLNGVVQGTLTFPTAMNDLSRSPISIVLYPQCTAMGPCGGGGFTHFESSATPQTLSYSIPVSSGQAYWMQVTSDYWGAVYPGGNQPQPNLATSSTAVVNMQFFPAGRVVGVMRKPDGSIYVPPTSMGGSPSVNAEGNNSWGWDQLNTDGSFSIGGLLPGDYTLHAQANGVTDFAFTTKEPVHHLMVSANQTISQDLYLSDAVTVRPIVSTAALPALSIFNCPPNGNGDCPPENWEAYALPQGTPLASSIVSSLLASGGGNTPGLFSFSPSTGQVNHCNGQYLTAPGFCVNPLAASKTGSAFDFYLLRKGGFDQLSYAGGARPYFIIENSTKNIIVDPHLALGVAFTPFGGPSGSTTPVQNLTLTPNPSLSGVSQATLAGTVTAASMINARQFQQLAGNFDKFLQYLPIVWAYDSSGTLKGAGLVVPFPPNVTGARDIQLNQAVASGDFAAFKALTGPLPAGWGALGYEIRGLTAGQSYNLVVTTPNYPPFKSAATLGAASSTTTVDVNLDLNQGVSISGVVQSTSAAAIAGAQVTVKAPGYAATTLTTDGTGLWRLDGLGAGQYLIQAVAAGYAQGSQIVDVSGTLGITVPTFSLAAANASISGTVYTNNPVCPAGATCSAFGKAVLGGVTVLAYDDTLNSLSPATSLPLFRAVTSSSGTFTISGLSTALIGGTTNYHTFKVFVNAPGYYVLNQSTETPVGAVVGFDFALKPKPLDVNVFGRPAGPNFEFQITNFMQFSGGNAWIGASPFTLATATALPQGAFVERPDAEGNTQLFLQYPIVSLSTGTVYTLHLEAQPNDPRAPLVIKEVPFGLNLPHAVCQGVDEALVGDDSGLNAQGLPKNLVPIDIGNGAGGNNSGLTLPVGGVIPALSTAIPSMCMSETDASASPQASLALRTSAVGLTSFVSGVYNVTLSSLNYTPKGVDLTLAYAQNGTALNDLAIYHFDTAAQKWTMVPGLQTIDPVKGTISVKGLKPLAGVLTVRGASSPADVNGVKAGLGLMALSDAKGFRPNTRTAATVVSGQFAVLRPSQVGGGSYTGTTVRVFNFPNPFNLQSKSVTLSASLNCSGGAGTITTGGTFIKYEIPAGISGAGVIRIYTTSGRLVRELDAGSISPSSCYYTQWDGKNRNGQPVANGAYYGILSVGGSKQSSGTFKLAVIK